MTTPDTSAELSALRLVLNRLTQPNRHDVWTAIVDEVLDDAAETSQEAYRLLMLEIIDAAKRQAQPLIDQAEKAMAISGVLSAVPGEALQAARRTLKDRLVNSDVDTLEHDIAVAGLDLFKPQEEGDD